MKKILILFLAALILFSGCVSEKTVKTGDTISLNYTVSLPDHSVFDTSIESVARENGITKSPPLEFKVGNPDMIKGLNEGVVGMKIGETKMIPIPPEKAFGPVKPELISATGLIENASAKNITFPRIFEIPIGQFETSYGKGHNKSDNLLYPDTNINITIKNISSSVLLSYDLKSGFMIYSPNLPWNMTVVNVNETNITIKPSVKLNDTIQLQFDQFQKRPWTSTVIGITDDNITLRNNPIPATKIQTMFGVVTVRFNETALIFDRNNELAGKTLFFNVTLDSIVPAKANAGNAT
ncbi:FKBP-type peptidyl-prolyl cis-trans isomerase [uncultured archaeon]|nr:FKBP-type peptidyl-prolyl cis-trans isomerase [uncultured archaeon]